MFVYNIVSTRSCGFPKPCYPILLVTDTICNIAPTRNTNYTNSTNKHEWISSRQQASSLLQGLVVFILFRPPPASPFAIGKGRWVCANNLYFRLCFSLLFHLRVFPSSRLILSSWLRLRTFAGFDSAQAPPTPPAPPTLIFPLFS